MTPERQADYIRSDEVADMRVPIDNLPAMFAVSRATIMRWLSEDKITRHPYSGSKFGNAPGKAVRFGDIIAARDASPQRWTKRDQ